jgi:hypothetical protein
MIEIERKYGMLLASLVIVVILGAQALAVIFRSEEWFWPFTDYPMYSTVHRDGDRLDKYYPLFAVFSDQSEKQVLPQDMDLTLFKFEGQLLPIIVCEAARRNVVEILPLRYKRHLPSCRPDSEARLRSMLERYEQRNGKKIARLRLEDYRYMITPKGAMKAPTKILLTLNLTQPNVAGDERIVETPQALEPTKLVKP